MLESFSRQKHQRIAATGSVASSGAHNADAFLSAALLWFKRVCLIIASERLLYVQQLWSLV